jgi:hypothetical protein
MKDIGARVYSQVSQMAMPEIQTYKLTDSFI